MIFVSSSCLKGRTGRFEKDFLHVLKVYERIGITNIELGAAHDYVSDLKPLFDFKRKNDANFILHCNFPPVKENFMLNIASCDEKIRDVSLKAAQASIDMCRKLDSKLFSLNGGFLCDFDRSMRRLNDLSDYEGAYSRCIDSLQTLTDISSQYGIRLAVENHYVSEGVMFTDISEFRRLLKDIRKNDLGVLIDLGHLKLNSVVYGKDQESFISEVKDRIMELHIHQIREGVGVSFGDDHRMIRDKSVLDIVPKDVLKRASLTLESNQLSPEEILLGVNIIESAL